MIQENVKDKCKVNSESNQQSVGSKESNEKVLGVVTHQIDQTKLNSVVIQKGPSDAPSPVSDEGFPVYRHSLELISSSEDEDLNMKTIKTVEIHKKVVRSSSSDSAFSLEDDVVPPEEQPPPTTKRRATLTVTDIPLRAALLPVPEPILLPDVSTGSFGTTKCDHLATTVPSKTLIEARIVELPDVGKIDGYESTSRRESTQSFVSDTDGVRYVRTPSVVVSDYSDHDVLCGITLEEYEYFQKHKLRRASCSDCDHSENMSASSSCSNLDFCGSTISGLDGGDYYQSTISERKISDCSSCFTASDEELDKTTVATDDATWHKKKNSGWRKLRNIVQWTPFFQTYKKQRYPWVQLAGHQGNFKAGPEQGTVLKKLCPKEELCFQILMKDVMRPYVPEYKGQISSQDGELYLQLQDLLSDFTEPCVMDCKVGVRTYLEEELSKAKEKPKLRKDMYEKMILIDPEAPTDDEHKAKAVTKPRYMVWRETISSTSTLGFRIEGIKKGDGTSSKDFKTTKSKEQIAIAFKDFTASYPHAIPKYIQRLNAIRATLSCSDFFNSHEVIGSSLLFVHDRDRANIWLIDFAKTVVLPDDVKIDHNSTWSVGNHEDGYLLGITNLINIFEEILNDNMNDECTTLASDLSTTVVLETDS